LAQTTQLPQLLSEDTHVARQTLHHFPRLPVLLEQIVHFVHRRAAAARDAAAAAAVDNHMIIPLPRRHRIDDGHDACEFLLIGLHILQLFHHADFRHHFQDRIERAQLAEALELIAKVFERELVIDQLTLHLLLFLHVEGFLRLLDEAHDVAHAQYPRGRAVRVEGLESVRFLTYADKLQRLACDAAYG